MSQKKDLLPSGALAVAGGPLGRHASARATSWLATVLPLLVAASATMALSVVQRAHCIQKGWVGSDQFWHACFSDLPAQYQLGNLQQGLAAYVGGDGARADHPVLTGSVMAWLGGLVPDGAFLDQTRWYFVLWAVLGTALAIAVVGLTAASRPQQASLAAHVALSPVLLLAAMVSSDLFGVALVSAGIWSWSRRRPVAAGVFLGLAVTARTYPLLILLALVLLGVRTGRLAVVGRTLVAAAGTVAVVLLPFLVGNPAAILRSTQVWWDSAAGLGSVWMLPQLLGAQLPVPATTLATVVGLLVAVTAGAVFALSPARRPTPAEVAFVLVALCLLAGKALPVQASLWLVPLVALCGLGWRDHLVWATAEALHFVAVWLYVAGLSTPDRGLPPGWYAVFLVIRVAAVGYLAWRVWHTAAARPGDPAGIPGSLSDRADQDAPDPSKTPASGAVGAPGEDGDELGELDEVDELEGEFAGATDRFLVRLA